MGDDAEVCTLSGANLNTAGIRTTSISKVVLYLKPEFTRMLQSSTSESKSKFKPPRSADVMSGPLWRPLAGHFSLPLSQAAGAHRLLCVSSTICPVASRASL